ncbi:hypothetical protein AKJ41_04735 [candidate division MSBL1 archaeon SCGC-AAA259O05]|uniref:Uncharacterized protein n=1 Tax=candidate division MSBL1 archaeon SCGC-AAA259O05 TaxID=1698271 RepID=A0A133V0C0_9EURY|nr:hypothetical protein AKJ41_04735 [candidate division MSBL1 archaeon SCGC-AAA259O05]
MDDWFDKEMKRLMKKFDGMFQRMMTPPGKQNLEPDKDFKTFEKKGPGFHMKGGIFNLRMGPRNSDRAATRKLGEDKKAEVVEEEKEEPRKLALRRFKEKSKGDEE